MTEEQVRAVGLLLAGMTDEEREQAWRIGTREDRCVTPGCRKPHAKGRRVCEACHKRRYRKRVILRTSAERRVRALPVAS